MNKKTVDYLNLVRVSVAKTALINPSDINMHDVLWMYGIKSKDKLLQVLYNIAKEGKFSRIYLVSDFFLEKITPDASLSYVAEFMPELLNQKTAIIIKERLETKLARLQAENMRQNTL